MRLWPIPPSVRSAVPYLRRPQPPGASGRSDRANFPGAMSSPDLSAIIVLETTVEREDGKLAAKVTQTQAYNYPR